MRIRSLFAVVSVMLLVLASACSREAGPMAGGGGADPGPEALRIKLDALTVDVCFREPANLPPPDCEKYVTQLASVPETIDGFRDAGPGLTKAARELAAGIRAYRNGRCAGAGEQDECGQALQDIARTLARVHDGVETLPSPT